MDLLRLVLARLPINILRGLNIAAKEAIYKLRAGFTPGDSYLKLCAFQGEFVDVFENQLCDLYRSRAAFLGDLDAFRKYPDGVPNFDVAFSSGIPEIQDEAFRLLLRSLDSRSVNDVTLVPRRASFRKSLTELAKTAQVGDVGDATIIGYVNYPNRVIYNRKMSVANSESMFLGFVKGIMTNEKPDPFTVDPRIESDLKRFVTSHEHMIYQRLIMEGYFYNHHERDGLLNALSGIQPRLFAEYVTAPNVKTKILTPHFVNVLFESIDDMIRYSGLTITQTVVDRAREMLRMETEGRIVFHPNYRNYLLVMTGQNVDRVEKGEVIYRLMTAVAHPQLTKERIIGMEVCSIRSNIFYDLPNYFAIQDREMDGFSIPPDIFYKLHFLFATGQFGKARHSSAGNILWRMLDR